MVVMISYTQISLQIKSHVDVVRLTLRPFLVHESVYGIGNRRAFHKNVHDLKKGLTQVWRTFLGPGYTLLHVLLWFVLSGINAGKGSQCPTARETFHVTNLSHKLWAEGRPTSFIAMTTGYLGRVEAVSSIFRRRDSTVSDAVRSIATACRISSFVLPFFGNTEIRSLMADWVCGILRGGMMTTSPREL